LPLLPVKNKILLNDIHFNFHAKMIDFHCLIKKKSANNWKLSANSNYSAERKYLERNNILFKDKL